MFKIFKSLWQPAIQFKENTVEDIDLGPLVWSKDLEVWESSPLHREIGFTFNIAGHPIPDDSLMRLAKSIAKKKHEFLDAVNLLLLSESKSPRYTGNIENDIIRLEIESVCILWPDHPTQAMIFFRSGADGREWHCDYENGIARGLVFDT
jgi:hypothetical protein